ncbi:MAG: cupin domain-containing protein [Hyphomicrobiales bacterium]|nr:cupin domain-containing protein [Hyphomicrobiales bacterium]MCP5370301.1 cupin domain-containing protein [Hyphomicrobiales bacterium]
MEAPRIIRAGTGAAHAFHGDGAITRLIYPDTAGSRKLFIGLADVAPGQAPHVFHRHDREVVGDRELAYADDFEEFYFVVSGRGTMQWIDETGATVEQPVAAGDAVYMPVGVMSHRILNTGDERLTVLYGGTPPARITPLEPGA